MLSRTFCSILAFAGTVAASLWTWVPVASGGSPSSVEDSATYVPIQSISYDFGSKSMNGYFVRQTNSCVVTLMIAEKIDPEEQLVSSPTRVRIVLNPKQIAGLDSEEGSSLNFTCGEGAETLIVDEGERETLVNLQERALQETIANKQ